MAQSNGITFKVAKHGAKIVDRSKPPTPNHYLYHLEELNEGCCNRVLMETKLNPETFSPQPNGFVHGILHAYNRHHNLLIRPDDVWLAIIAQFGLYVTGNAEKLRSIFVDHQGKKSLAVHGSGSLVTADYGWLAQQMTEELKNNLKDSEIREWVLPNFSTTTNNDKIVGSVLMMATMKKYFSYSFDLECGIPQVTLAGTVEDWEEIDKRVDRLHQYGECCSKWAVLLKKITPKLVDTRKGNINTEFWSKICHYEYEGSGSTYLTGWVSSFCVFNQDGGWQGGKFTVYNDCDEIPIELDFPLIDTEAIPRGYLTVDVDVVDDDGKHDTLMFAGHMGYDIVDGNKGIAPKLAWAIALKDK